MAFRAWSMAGRRQNATQLLIGLLTLLAAACGSELHDGESSEEAQFQNRTRDPDPGLPITVFNQGGELEGHTPRGFAGSGTGLFAGDNLNPNFPNDDGVQLWLSFALPTGTATPTRATLSSDALTVAGTPFEALGELRAAPVRYESFGPPLFAIEPDSAGVGCIRRGTSGLDCEVTAAVADALNDGRSTVQFRLRFETASDQDGRQDLALFFLTDSNTNEQGIFSLTLE